MFLDATYWEPKPVDSFESLSIEEITNRAIFVFGQCVSFCNDDTFGEGFEPDAKRRARQERAAELKIGLESWKKKLPLSTAHFLSDNSSPIDSSTPFSFQSLWFLHPQGAIAFQVYHASKILLNLHFPPEPVGHYHLEQLQHLTTRRCIEQSRNEIFLISNAGIPDTWSLISTQCLYIAGLVTDGVLERNRTLELIERCQESSGRRTKCLADALRQFWAQ
ncbi:fungal specific transcription factor domain-containing protein [Aspergillus brunneoviolaceus CBS 621.78]|uniref:Uncharacterized protein n=1 Tax=Aspergillus brunneoviolaceus CBS 621.78 TaxID=1450534 RepID=A0ACD1GK86_9EURO|nr:hypothetical protein BO95DRAFT_244174 [Aspergillus brunneoviolaceus CBS 621.78]RAH49740.1 hypothetical protein BO95DRAFT_244174 [Aspergillus brunneoviolaceus CBS 621.78]